MNISLPLSVSTNVLGVQRNCLIEMVLLGTHNIYFGREKRKSIFCDTLLTKGLHRTVT